MVEARAVVQIGKGRRIYIKAAVYLVGQPEVVIALGRQSSNMQQASTEAS